ncbi:MULTISPECIES: HK97-gp10 family putative phage morphogenesis protein [unclassified Granulicatella]|uniref:HK97-gp10 family putative phage morphogenesis protein n=1 Tax=unclassified Granulicatella TaxID=2630493 RepID=UPI0010738226|nr:MULTISPECIES: HK97-gp10 family putative phage morphogenesis protein [unclassified Granulicatella]MBF0780511.1 hypothetical protein [Granulicatella sp. 19428wC4_WM01]TFU95326.1 hypothetical protein E4T68_05330 [Granulicatella sp. WM01]
MPVPTIDISGIDEMFSVLDTTVNRINRSVNDILKESAEPIKKRIEETVPVSKPMKHSDEGHAVKDVHITNVKSSQHGYVKYVDVGFRVTEWRMWFLEFGTIHIQPRHYVERAGLHSRQKVLSIQKRKLKALLKQRGVF